MDLSYVPFKASPPEKVDAAYLRGLIDGDGCLFFDKKPDGRCYPNVMLCYATSQPWIRDLWLDEMENRGYPTRVHEYSTQGRVLLRRSADARTLAAELYSDPPSLERKHTIAMEMINGRQVTR